MTTTTNTRPPKYGPLHLTAKPGDRLALCGLERPTPRAWLAGAYRGQLDARSDRFCLKCRWLALFTKAGV